MDRVSRHCGDLVTETSHTTARALGGPPGAFWGLKMFLTDRGKAEF